jgi:hypothetical protein
MRVWSKDSSLLLGCVAWFEQVWREGGLRALKREEQGAGRGSSCPVRASVGESWTR